MKRKLGIMIECLKGKHPSDTLELIRDAGFECYFTGRNTHAEVSELVKKGNSMGLSCEFIHAPFKNINSLWLDGMDYLWIYNEIKTSIDIAAENGIPSVIVHVSSGWNAPAVNDIGLSRYDSLVLYAAERGVKIAFENLRKVGNLAYLADRYEHLENVGFCYDCGHEHCYTKTVCWPDIFRGRIIATHIHDNFGRGDSEEGDPDLHLVPFEGNLDYAKMMRKLDEYNYTLPLILEIDNGRHRDMPEEDFLKMAYERLVKISNM